MPSNGPPPADEVYCAAFPYSRREGLATVEGRVIVEASAGVITATVALVVVAGGPKRAPNVYLACFLVLIAANLAGGLVFPAWLWAGGGPATAALDPFFLYCFASVHPRRNRLSRPAALAAAAAPAIVLAFVPAFLARAEYRWAQDFHWTGLNLYTAVVYTIVLRRVARAVPEARDAAAGWSLLAATGLAAIPAWARAAQYGAVFAWTAAGGGNDLVLFFFSWAWIWLGLLVGVGLAAAAAREHGRDHVRRSLRWLAPAVALEVAYLAFILLARARYEGWLPVGAEIVRAIDQVVGVGKPALKWDAFGVLVSVAVVRGDALGLRLRDRRWAARAFVGLFAALAMGLAFEVVAAATGSRGSVGQTELVLFGAVLFATQGFRRVIALVAWRLYAVPPPGDRDAAMATYARAARQALESGRAPSNDPALARLREELDLDERTARAIERVSADEMPVVLAPGALVLGRYRVARLLGRGGGGRAFLAHDDLLQRDVVVKEVRHTPAATEAAALREARLAGAAPHPNVVTVHDVAPRSGASLIITEFVAGGSLADALARGVGFDGREALRLLDQILAGLVAVHARGIVHGDLKPANVLLTPEGVPKIADFGIARERRDADAGGRIAPPAGGTPAFMAPEQREGEVTPRSDLYAVGRIARVVSPGPFPPALEAVIAGALATDPRDRPASADEMRRALAEAGGLGAPEAAGARELAASAPVGTTADEDERTWVPTRSGPGGP